VCTCGRRSIYRLTTDHLDDVLALMSGFVKEEKEKVCKDDGHHDELDEELGGIASQLSPPPLV
jgi:hypothetical protein